MKILAVFGTRPEAIKMAPILKLVSGKKNFEIKSCVTGQHKEMLQQVLDFFKITVEYNLDVMTQNQNLSSLTSKLIDSINGVVEKYQPELILVQGDTTSALCGALVGFYNKIPVAHIEAGLRSYNKYAPFPEEINRKLISNIAEYHFCPTETSKNNLLSENFNDNIYVVGNTVIDALNMAVQIINDNKSHYDNIFSYLKDNKLILVTGHRRENFGMGFENICNALANLAELYPDITIVYPVHLNPNVLGPVKKILGKHKNIYLLSPQDYPSMIYLLMRAYIVLTDSGGIQEEAPSLGKPVLVMRDVTERTEGVQAGTALLVGTDTEKIISEVEKLLNEQDLYKNMSNKINPYGDGQSSKRIINELINT